ncbi:MAG: PilZ protein [Hyphomicrobiales bacterium]|nr:PilZ protein [Hyphomicrobiales bacterium]
MDSDFQPDRRRAERMRTLLNGRIYYRSSRASLDCHIRDLSAAGACLKGEGVADTPDRFHLEIPGRNRLHGVHVRWRKGDRIGVGFETAKGAPP